VREVGNKTTESTILAYRGMHMCDFGHRYQGYLATIEAEKVALESNDIQAILRSRVIRGFTERWMGRPLKAIELTEGIVEAARSMFFIDDVSALIFLRGIALAELGRIDEAREILRSGIDMCEKYRSLVHLGRLYNCMGYCFGEILHPEKAWEWNVRSDEIGRWLMERYPVSVTYAGEIVTQANVNMLENLLDQADPDVAWNRLISFAEESTGEDFSQGRDRYEVRMDMVAAQLLLQRNDPRAADERVSKYLDRVKQEHLNKYHGRLLRLLGEIQFRKGKIDSAMESISEAIEILKEVGNPRQLWQAHDSLAQVYNGVGRGSEAREQWGVAAEVIQKTAAGLSDRELREGFLGARPIREILSKAV